MASIFAHGFLAFSLGNSLEKEMITSKVLWTGIFLSIIPDMDVIAFAFGIPYESIWGHRGVSHSILFALITSTLISMYFIKSLKHSGSSSGIFIFLFLSMVSHGFLDAMTTGGLGVGFFIPFDTDRYFFNYRPILVSPIGIDSFLSSWGLAVILSEIKTVGLVCVLLLLSAFVRKRFITKQNQ